MRLKGFERTETFYFIGIGGVSMSALAKFFSVQGYKVFGSDGVKSEQTEMLAFYGIRAFLGEDGEREELKRADVVVYTDAIPVSHAELITAKKMQKRLLSRAELLSQVGDCFKSVIAVAGSHGKTTCTSMCAHVLKTANVPFTAHIGGEDLAFGNFYTSGLEYFLTEICEYKRNLLKIRPDVAVTLNIDRDHMECYQNEEDLISCFRRYCGAAKTAFVCADDERCASLGNFATFGLKNPLADYRATELRANGERYSFTIEEYGNPLCRVNLKAIGRHNVYNALAAFAATRSYGFSEKEIKKGLEAFTAVKRRFEKIGEYHGASFVCDYAHHPREILSAVSTAKSVCKGRLFVVFQPHTYSRTRLLMREFVEVLRSMEYLMIYKTYPARERYDEAGSGERLAEEVGNCLYAENVYALRTWLKTTVKEGDLVLFLGAGDIYYAAQYVQKELN